jgi:DNA topoisomerase VI subunit A
MSLNLNIQSAVRGVTKEWKKAKRKADKRDRISASALKRMRYRPPRITTRDVAFEVMKSAYNKASSNGKYYANARQIMYAARPEILSYTGEEELSSSYFTQTLLKDYLEIYNPPWKVVWDARGHVIEPYTNKRVGIGGSEVLKYREKWTEGFGVRELPGVHERIETKGPDNRFNNVLFIEKEGFTEILMDAKIPERYSMALMSTKGIPVAAACDLIKSFTAKGVKVFVLHDFDLAGFKILRTLRRGTRLSVGSGVIDIGFRMADILDLDSEPVVYNQKKNPRYYLQYDCGATEEEANFLVTGRSYYRYSGRRVEINAMTSEQLINWLDKKFAEHGVKKYMPDDMDTIVAAYQRAKFLQRVEEEIKQIAEEIETEEVDNPKRLYQEIVEEMQNSDGSDARSWDQVVWDLAIKNDD